MKKAVLAFVMLLALAFFAAAQQPKGVIYADTGGILVVKVWGTHSDRGYALGYLTGDRITDVIVNYIKPSFGIFYTMARNTVTQGNDLSIPPEYDTEAQAVIDGMNAAGTNTASLDKTDILVGNTFLDISNLLSIDMGMNCSELMSWNEATAGTDLNGTPVVTRHLDWEYSAVLNRNNIITVHFPGEPNESKWLLAGFSGMIGVLSGLSPDVGVFQNMMDDYTSVGLHNKHYTPIWFALRRAIEASDYNGDGHRDVSDVRSALTDCTAGFSDGFIISALAKSNPADSLVAMVAEITSTSPMHTFRSSAYPDSIPGDNLYTANYQIARNNLMHFCTRYNGIRNHIGDGTLIGRDTSWNLMKTWSHLSTNTQFMQFAPEADLFRMSIYRNGQPAYQNDPVEFSLAALFNDPTTGTGNPPSAPALSCRYDPLSSSLIVRSDPGIEHLELFDLTGRRMVSAGPFAGKAVSVPVTGLKPGIYLVRVTARGSSRCLKVPVSLF